MRVICAPDSFKGSLDAKRVAEAIRRGVLRAAPHWRVEIHPLADGGEGTLDILSQHGFELETSRVQNQLGVAVQAAFGLRGSTAIIESARACGFAANATPHDAGRATSFGVGQLIASALGVGATEILLTIGGTATTDGGAGMITALGGKFLTASGEPVQPGGLGLLEMHAVDISGLDSRLATASVRVLCDVTNPLLGPNGAAETFGPQKGADPETVALLETGLAKFQAVLNSKHANHSGSGAGGGLGFAALEFFGAQVVSGAREVMHLTGFADALQGADLVITGEGSFDSQSLAGKVPYEVVAAAKQRGIPVVLVCGTAAELPQAELVELGVHRILRLTDLQPDVALSIRDAETLLERLGSGAVSYE